MMLFNKLNAVVFFVLVKSECMCAEREGKSWKMQSKMWCVMTGGRVNRVVVFRLNRTNHKSAGMSGKGKTFYFCEFSSAASAEFDIVRGEKTHLNATG